MNEVELQDKLQIEIPVIDDTDLKAEDEDVEEIYSPGFHLLAASIGTYGVTLSWYKDVVIFIYVPWIVITLFGFGCISYHWVRTESKSRATGFRVPLMPFPSLFAVLTNTHLLAGLPAMAFLYTFLLCAVTILFYACYGRHHSLLKEEIKEATSVHKYCVSPVEYGVDINACVSPTEFSLDSPPCLKSTAGS